MDSLPAELAGKLWIESLFGNLKRFGGVGILDVSMGKKRRGKPGNWESVGARL